MLKELHLIKSPSQRRALVLMLCITAGFLVLVYHFKVNHLMVKYIDFIQVLKNKSQQISHFQDAITFMPESKLQLDTDDRPGRLSSGITSHVLPTSKAASPKPTLPLSSTAQQISASLPPAACSFPDINPFHPEVKKLTKTFPALNCSGGIPSIVKVIGDELKIDLDKVHASRIDPSSISCRYRSHRMTPGQDFETTLSSWSASFNTSIKLKPHEEHLIAECYKNTISEFLVAKSYLSIIRETMLSDHVPMQRNSRHASHTDTREALNVLMVGIDGMSRSQMIRSMPQTRKLLAQTPGVFELTKHNKVGINTFPNVIPLLTGMKAEEHATWTPEKPMDLFHFIWEDFERAGYRTQLVLDKKMVTAFHNSKLGWTKPPVMFYNRPTVVASESDRTIRSVDENCIGDTPEVTLLTDYQQQLVRLSNTNNLRTRPVFSYSFFVRLTHDDYNKASAGDELYYRFLHELIGQGRLNNTILIFFSDHGPRFGPIRRTVTGMLEGPTPFCFILVPTWLLRRYPRIHTALSINQNQLTTNFDLHQTLKDILNFQGEGQGQGEGKNRMPGGTQRGISLFRVIPQNRTCHQAGIDIVWCSCNTLSRLDNRSRLALVIADKFVSSVNAFTAKHRSLCIELNVKTIPYAFHVQSNYQEQLVKDADLDLYKIAVETTPGHAVYEGLIQYSTKANSSSIVGAMDRLNMFQTQAKCMKLPELKPFCFCQGLNI